MAVVRKRPPSTCKPFDTNNEGLPTPPICLYFSDSELCKTFFKYGRYGKRPSVVQKRGRA